MTEKTQRKIDWFFWQGVLTVTVIHGVVFGSEPSANAFKFLAWIGGFFAFVTLSSKDVQKALAKDGPSMPPRITGTLHMILAVILASRGWFGYAVLIMLQAFACAVYLPSGKTQEESCETEVEG